MPNHVHVLVEPFEGHTLESIAHSWKSFTAHEANKILDRNGRFWQYDFWDRFIRGPEHFKKAIEYIHKNPLVSKLVVNPEDWPYGSARWGATLSGPSKNNPASGTPALPIIRFCERDARAPGRTHNHDGNTTISGANNPTRGGDARVSGGTHAGSATVPVANQQARERDARAPVAIHFRITGAVQGVGFRPFVYRLAHELGISGWIKNDAEGVLIEARAHFKTLEIFEKSICDRAPAAARIKKIVRQEAAKPATESEFRILDSDPDGAKTAQILPDLATCLDCIREIFDPADRRHLYPFTNCTNCGPRFSILERLPYDRPNTTMKQFAMCDRCRAEYEDPANRRFHAQPNACPDCGPRLEWWNNRGMKSVARRAALIAAAAALRHGRVVAVKGLGGFHLMVDARNNEAVRLLRERKHREEKPLAIMVPSLAAAKIDCEVSPTEERVLLSPESPIVLLRRRPDSKQIAPLVAPRNPYLGVMLPYTPLHHILLRELGFPVVATSGNLSDEPICAEEREAMERLGGIADAFLVHNRPIARPMDDSIVRVIAGQEAVLRRARGFAPRPLTIPELGNPILAVGAHLKNTVALAHRDAALISQHIGDLETFQSDQAFRKAVDTLEKLYETKPTKVACDMHPDYLSTQYARDLRLPTLAVQHHHAHIAACMAENELDGQALGVAWDGAGYGTDGTIWGGEFLLASRKDFHRVAHMRLFRLPGGETAIREPRRAAIGALYVMMGDAAFERTDLPPVAAFTPRELAVLKSMLHGGLNSPLTSSAGRLFDIAASLIGLRQVSTFEGQAAMELEFAIARGTSESYPFRLEDSDSCVIVNWSPIMECVLDDRKKAVETGLIAAKFHNTMVEIIVAVAKRIGEARVVLSGGCFQNVCLTERAVSRLAEEGYMPYWHRLIPPNDGGISFGQAVVAASQ
jgi:hydrogenase maturation protein HypF